MLTSVVLGKRSFADSLETVFANLPSLRSIKLGEFSLCGRHYDSRCSLTMRDLPKLSRLISKGSSLRDARTVILKNIPSLETVCLPSAFNLVSDKSIHNVSSSLTRLL
ncbi:uncharacterized protein [Blastocystis hominis]|uniref:Uncharacterized protein n=1 Tax=Blastocystis hominis TaxID=12968 RepID=D8LUV1_BLAHO|nr:uncharacterized protein [Blastocystis hominis]CBK19590.2 unnamed protein product [Blastocystis hominis]|eukprot:XP_012893638.1 uncharacterized protein [Blastocystis hominis]